MPVPYVDALAWNHAEGGTPGATPTTGNSGGESGTAMGVQILGASTILVDDTAPIHGTRSYRIQSSGGIAALRWGQSVLGDLVTLCVVAYVRFETLPSAYTDLISGYATDAGGASKGWAAQVNASGNFRLRDGAASTLASSSAVITAGAVWRLEAQINHLTGAYTLEVSPGDSETPIQALTGTAAGLTVKESTCRVDFGRGSAPELDVTVDTLAVSDRQLGPRFVPGDTARPQVLVSNAGGWTVEGGAPMLTALGDESDATLIQTPMFPDGDAVRLRLHPLSRTDIVTVTTRGRASDAAESIQRTVQIYNGATLLTTDTWNLTTAWVNRATATPAPVAAGTELEVAITDLVV